MTQGEQDRPTSRTCEHFTLMSSWPWRSPCYCCAHHTLTRSGNGYRKGKKRRENDGHSRQSRARLAPSTVERRTFEAGEPTARRRAPRPPPAHMSFAPTSARNLIAYLSFS